MHTFKKRKEIENNSTLKHQHFALFSLVGNATTYYLGYEDSLGPFGFAGTNGFEKIGDYNDFIVRISTSVLKKRTGRITTE